VEEVSAVEEMPQRQGLNKGCSRRLEMELRMVSQALVEVVAVLDLIPKAVTTCLLMQLPNWVSS
jgi:hypothetical protein